MAAPDWLVLLELGLLDNVLTEFVIRLLAKMFLDLIDALLLLKLLLELPSRFLLVL